MISDFGFFMIKFILRLISTSIQFFSSNKEKMQEGQDEDDQSDKSEDESINSEDEDDLETDYVNDILNADAKKLIDERLEKGEQLRFVARVPYNITQLMKSYYTMS